MVAHGISARPDPIRVIYTWPDGRKIDRSFNTLTGARGFAKSWIDPRKAIFRTTYVEEMGTGARITASGVALPDLFFTANELAGRARRALTSVGS